MNRVLLIISILLGLTDFTFCQVDQDSLKSVKTISNLTQNQKETVENDSLRFLSGHVFSKSINHKYIRLSNRSGTYIHIYSEKDQYKEPIFTARIHWMNFMNDSIFDINGDEVTDLAIHWYPSSGCCLADIYNCVIYNEDTDQFSEIVEIPNPTFYPDKNQTYSMTYGHPGETKFYEFRWTKNTIDTLKSYEWNDRSHKHIILTNFKTGTHTDLKNIPKNLPELYGFDWFMMRLNNEDEK